MYINTLIIGDQACLDVIAGKHCVVIGEGAKAGETDLGKNLFHVEGVISTVIDADGWEDAVRQARKEVMRTGDPDALEPLLAFTNAEADDLRQAFAAALEYVDPRAAPLPKPWEPPEAPDFDDLEPTPL
nr:hypothetical protein VO57_15905 [Citromicrobium sp. JL2201]